MLKGFKILTVTHKNVPLTALKNYIVPSADDSELAKKLSALKKGFGLEELFYLATCNRVMYFFYQPSSSRNNIDQSFVFDFLQKANPSFQSNLVEDFEKTITLLEGEEAMEHLLEVAGSVDSMVIGEREILRQMRIAYGQCKELNLIGDHIRLAMRQAIETAKKIYSQTRIGEKPVSIVSLAIQKLLKAHFPKTGKLLLIGAGQTNLLVAKFLKKHQFSNVTVFNRSIEKANSIADLLDGKSLLLEDLKKYTDGFDGIIICTGSDQPIIDNELYSFLLQEDLEEKLVIDLAIPNNVNKSVVDYHNINYIEIEGLRSLAKENLGFREKEILKAKEHIAESLKAFKILHQQRQIEKAMQLVPNQIKAVKAHAMNQVFKKDIENLDEKTIELLDKMLTYMEKRCISIPMQAAKDLVQ